MSAGDKRLAGPVYWDSAKGELVPGLRPGYRYPPAGWYVWDRETNNACGHYPTEAEAREACARFQAANPDFAADFIVFEDPT